MGQISTGSQRTGCQVLDTCSSWKLEVPAPQGQRLLRLPGTCRPVSEREWSSSLVTPSLHISLPFMSALLCSGCLASVSTLQLQRNRYAKEKEGWCHLFLSSCRCFLVFGIWYFLNGRDFDSSSMWQMTTWLF